MWNPRTSWSSRSGFTNGAFLRLCSTTTGSCSSASCCRLRSAGCFTSLTTWWRNRIRWRWSTSRNWLGGRNSRTSARSRGWTRRDWSSGGLSFACTWWPLSSSPSTPGATWSSAPSAHPAPGALTSCWPCFSRSCSSSTTSGSTRSWTRAGGSRISIFSRTPTQSKSGSWKCNTRRKSDSRSEVRSTPRWTNRMPRWQQSLSSNQSSNQNWSNRPTLLSSSLNSPSRWPKWCAFNFCSESTNPIKDFTRSRTSSVTKSSALSSASSTSTPLCRSPALGSFRYCTCLTSSPISPSSKSSNTRLLCSTKSWLRRASVCFITSGRWRKWNRPSG